MNERWAAGAAVASALMAANYPGDSGEDVDRLIHELAKLGYVIARRRLDREALRTAIYETSVAHDWENTTDREDRTDEIADRYATLTEPTP